MTDDSPITEAEYLAYDEQSDLRHEYANGKVYALVGHGHHVELSPSKVRASLEKWANAEPLSRMHREHSTVLRTLLFLLYDILSDMSCIVTIIDARVQVPTAEGYVLPDLVLQCDDADYVPVDGIDALTNPKVIIEVVSPLHCPARPNNANVPLPAHSRFAGIRHGFTG